MIARLIPLGLVLALLSRSAGAAEDGPDVLRLASVGVPIPEKRAAGRAINELRLHDGRLYVGTGDATVNTGPTDVVAFDPATGKFARELVVQDEGIYLFRVLDGKLAIPGVDATESWEFGNVYVREDGGWVKHRSVPRGIHVFDLAEWRGRWWAAAGTFVTPKEEEQIAVGGLLSSTDRGATWRYERLTPGDRRAVWRYRSLAAFQGRLYAFPYAYREVPVGAVPEDRRAGAGKVAKDEEGADVHVLYQPDPLGAADAEVFDGEVWTAVDLVPDADVVSVVPHTYRERLLLSVVAARWLAPFGDYLFEHRRLPEGAEAFLLAFDGKRTARVPLAYDALRDLRVGDDGVAALILRDGRYLLAESADLESWTTRVLALGDGHPLSVEKVEEDWFVGMKDGNLMRSAGTAPAGAPAQPDRFEIRAHLITEGKGPWAAIDAFADRDRPARLVCARTGEDAVAVALENVDAFRVFTRDAGIRGDLELSVDGRVVFRGGVGGAGELLATRGDEGWKTSLGEGTSATYEPPLEVVGAAAVDLLRTGPTAAQWVADAIRDFAGADLALVNLGCVRGDLPKGPIHASDLDDFVYPNKVATFRATGAALVAMLRHNCGLRGWNRCAVSGFTATLDAEGAYVASTLDPAREYVVAIPDWTVLHAGELFGRLVEHEVKEEKLKAVLLAWLESHGTVKELAPRLTPR